MKIRIVNYKRSCKTSRGLSYKEAGKREVLKHLEAFGVPTHVVVTLEQRNVY